MKELSKKSKRKNPHAVALGRKGGKAPKTKPAGFAAMDKDKLREIASKGAAAREARKKQKY